MTRLKKKMKSTPSVRSEWPSGGTAVNTPMRTTPVPVWRLDACRVVCRYRDLRYEMENIDSKGKRRVLHEDELVRGGLSVDPTPSDRQAVIAMRDRLADLEGQLALAKAMKGKDGLLPDDDMLGERRSALAAENRQVPAALPAELIHSFYAHSSTTP